MKVYLILLLFTLSFSLDEDNHKWVYTYGAGKAEGDRTMRNLLGGKGVGLHDMCFRDYRNQQPRQEGQP